MLASLLFALTPQTETRLPAYMGRATHAWFMEQIQRLDRELAGAMHTPNQDRPFTVSDLWGPDLTRQGTNEFKSDNTYTLRVTAYRPDLVALLQEKLATAPPAMIQLAQGRFEVRGTTLDEAVSPWAGCNTLDGLAQAQQRSPEIPDQVTLLFASPTVFRSRGNYLPFPLPRLVFEGLIRRWNGLAATPLPAQMLAYVEENLAISRYSLQTERVDAGKRGAAPGCVGSCTYALRVRDRYWMEKVHLLANFAFYAGVGRQTTMGFGQVRALEDRHDRSAS